MSDFVFSVCVLVNNQLSIRSFAPEKNTKYHVEDFSGEFLLWLSVYFRRGTRSHFPRAFASLVIIYDLLFSNENCHLLDYAVLSQQ